MKQLLKLIPYLLSLIGIYLLLYKVFQVSLESSIFLPVVTFLTTFPIFIAYFIVVIKDLNFQEKNENFRRMFKEAFGSKLIVLYTAFSMILFLSSMYSYYFFSENNIIAGIVLLLVVLICFISMVLIMYRFYKKILIQV